MAKALDMGMNDRRSCPRAKVPDLTALVLIRNGQPERCKVVDASRHGALIESSLSLMTGMTVELALVRRQGANVIRVFRRWARVTRRSRESVAVCFVNRRQVPRISPRGVWPYSGLE
jgi:hypothetical protein